jgi:branched-chain amino acid transport system substrate-binding protein
MISIVTSTNVFRSPGYFRVAAASLLSVAACAQITGADGDPPTVAPRCTGAIHVRIASDFSGTATDIAIPHFFGLYDHLRYINSQGGLSGCPIDIQTADNHYTGPGTQTVIENWAGKADGSTAPTDPDWANVNTVFVFGTGPTTTVYPLPQMANKVIIPGSYAGAFTTPDPIDKTITYPFVTTAFAEQSMDEVKKSSGYPYIFYPATDYSTGIRVAIQAAYNIAPGRMAMAHEVVDSCAYCVDPLAAGKRFIKSPAVSGMELGRDLIIPQTSDPAMAPTIDAAVQSYIMQEVAQVKADPNYKPVMWIWSGNSVFATSILGQSLWKAQTTLIDSDMSIPLAIRTSWKLRVIANNWGIGETANTICAGAACTHDNFYGLFPVPKYGDATNSAAMAEIVSHHDHYGALDSAAAPPIPARTADQYADVRYVQGYAAALLWEMGMRAAIMAGHRNPTGTDLKEAFEKFDNISLNGATAQPITFTTADHRPQSGEGIYKLDPSGKLVFVARYNIPLMDDWLGY